MRSVRTCHQAREWLPDLGPALDVGPAGSAGVPGCIEPAHDLLDGLVNGDHRAVRSAVDELDRFGGASGAALTCGIRAALLALPASAT